MSSPPKKPKSKKPTLHGLEKRFTRKYARDFLDLDYVDQLSPEEARWMDKFCREFYQNTFKRDGTDLQDDEQRRECYRVTNSRNRDMWNQFRRLAGDTTDTTDIGEDDDTDG
jgi:hypothetical protein